VTEAKPTLSALIHFPPFGLVLVEPVTAPEYPHLDCTAWLELGVDEVAADFEFAFPGVKLASSIVATPAGFEATVV
jgi:hypothetical protein